jgi:hypothetical protein
MRARWTKATGFRERLPGRMTAMATWKDGTEYAPAERPDGFATPRVAALTVAPPVQDLAAGAPTEPPGTFEQQVPAIPLAQLVPATGPGRDPRLAFTEAARSGSGAWGAVHIEASPSWSPDQPLLTSAERGQNSRPRAASFAPASRPPTPGMPTPGVSAPGMPAPGGSPFGAQPGPTSSGYTNTGYSNPGYQNPGWPTGSGQPGYPAPEPVTIGAAVANLGWWVLAVLAAGVLLAPISVVLLGVATLLVYVVKYGRTRLARVFWLVLVAALAGGLITSQGYDQWDSINQLARIASAVMIPVSVWLSFAALKSRQS